LKLLADINDYREKAFADISKGFLLLALLFALVSTPEIKAASGNKASAGYAEKAAYLYSILRFVYWDDDSQLAQTESLNVCLFKHDPFGHSLDSVRGKTIGNRQVKFKTISSTEQSGLCHLIYFSDKSDYRILKSEPSFEHEDTILLGNDIEFLKAGGLLSIYIENDKIRLAANRSAINNAGVNLSSLLLETCQIYGEEP
jgi:hypothetical protein